MAGAGIIYIVDDDIDVRASIAFVLRTDGLKCRIFPSGDAFIAELDALQPGCILLDVRMPGMDGLEVLTELMRRGCRWPVVVMTGHGERNLAQKAVRLGAVDFVEKPFDVDLMIACLKQACQRIPG